MVLKLSNNQFPRPLEEIPEMTYLSASLNLFPHEQKNQRESGF
jgi:hypothetical protein